MITPTIDDLKKLVKRLEDLKYKYSSAKHDGPLIQLAEMNEDMIVILDTLLILMGPF